jgi:hypothetical protein
VTDTRRRLPGGKRLAFEGALVTLLLVLGIALTIQAFSRHVLIKGEPYYLLGEDAMISMRYAYNLAKGRGFVWNPVEYV